MDMTLNGSVDSIVNDGLPHEICHVLLAHHFGRVLPRWADEGAAVLSADSAEKTSHENTLRIILKDPGRFIPLQQLLGLSELPADAAALYAEGYSLTRFLVESRNRAFFLKFVADGMRVGWDQAVLRHYGHKNVVELEQAWRVWVEKQPIPSRGKESVVANPDSSQTSATASGSRRNSKTFDLDLRPPFSDGGPHKLYTVSFHVGGAKQTEQDTWPTPRLGLIDGKQLRVVRKDKTWENDAARTQDRRLASLIVDLTISQLEGNKVLLLLDLQENDIDRVTQFLPIGNGVTQPSTQIRSIGHSLLTSQVLELGKRTRVILAEGKDAPERWVDFTVTEEEADSNRSAK